MGTLIAAIVEGMRQTAPFHFLPVMNRPLDTLWNAHNQTLLALRLPLHYRRLHKRRPSSKLYDEAIQSGLALLGSFAQQMGTKQAIVRLESGAYSDISFQPRPFAANWTKGHALSPGALADPMTDPLTLTGQLPTLSTGDMLHLAGKVALVVADKADLDAVPSGTATFEFVTDKGRVDVRVIYRPLKAHHTQPSHIEMLRWRT